MSRVRVVVAATPGLLAEIILDALREVSDFEVSAVESPPSAMILDEFVPHVLILVSQGSGGDSVVQNLLYRFPRLRVLTVFDDGRQTTLHVLAPSKRDLGPVSPEGLISAIRDSWRAEDSDGSEIE